MEKKIKEREINLIDLFWAVCLKWRQIIIGAIIFALLAVGLGYFKDSKEASKPKVVPTTENIVLEKDSLDKLKLYLKYNGLLKKQVQYNKNAPLMKLDANGFYVETITYFVDNYFVTEFPIINKVNNIEGLLAAYRSSVYETSFLSDIYSAVEAEYEFEVYCAEVLDCNNRFKIDSNIGTESNMLVISIYGSNADNCKQLSKIVQEKITSSKSKIEQKFGKHELILISDECNNIASKNLLAYQDENINKENSYINTLELMQTKMSDNEKAYIQAYEKENSLDGGKDIENENEITSNVQIRKKVVAIGFIGGAALVLFIFILIYLFNNKLCLEDDFESIFGVKLFGTVIYKKEKSKRIFSFLDKFILKMRHFNKHYFEFEKALEMSAAGIKIASRKMGTNKVYATGNVIGKEEKAVLELLAEELKKFEIEIVIGNPILYDAEALEKSAEIGCVVLIESVGNVLYREVADEIEICEQQGTKLIGAIIVA